MRRMIFWTAMTTESKTILLGSVGGALIMGTILAFVWWALLYTDANSGGGFLGTSQDWAPIAAMVGGVIGLVTGAVLGFFLSLKGRGSLFGALAGALEGLAIVVILLAPKGFSLGDTRVDLMLAAFVPAGAVSGFLTSLMVSTARKQV
jgi:hypothetical protein